jgi:hypothetical protein
MLDGTGTAMSLESLPEHIRRPHLRPVQPQTLIREGKAFVALRDPVMVSRQMVILPLQAVGVLQHFRGERSLAEIADQLKGDLSQFVALAERLDQIGLLWGPTFERMEADLRQRLRARGAFPPNLSKTMGADATECRGAIERYFRETESPDLEAPAAGIVAPHLDYARGWPNYAAAYSCLRDLDAPQRVVILATNHFGLGDGVVLSELGFESPMGRCPADQAVVAGLLARLGEGLIADHLDHMAEHSVELHLPWLQYAFGDVPVVAALLPDPLAPMIAEDGRRVTGAAYVEALRDVLREVGGRTLFVASSDLSHVGMQYGEPRPVDEQRRIDVERHDREMLANFLTGDAETFLAGFQWNRNPTRWCSIGNMTALLMLVQPDAVELIDYRQAFDEKGIALVSSAAIAVIGDA